MEKLFNNSISKNQYVLFENGHKGEYLEVCWSIEKQSFAYCSDETDENGNWIIYYSNNVIEKPKKAKKTFVPCKENCTVRIFPVFETEKAYAVNDGSNGLITRNKEYYRYIAKSICYVDENGNIYAPVFAAKYLEH